MTDGCILDGLVGARDVLEPARSGDAVQGGDDAAGCADGAGAADGGGGAR